MDLIKNAEIFLFFLVLYCINGCYGNRTRDRMYENIDSASPCFRRMNATHQIGCSSERGGSIGVIHFCTSQSDLNFILKNGTAPPYTPIIPTTLFTASNANLLRESAKISGLLVYAAANDRPHAYSHDRQCPNSRFGKENTCGGDSPVWNPFGTSLLFQDFPFPIFYVDDESQLKGVRECFQKHNNFSYNTQRDRSLCSLQLSSFMHATTNTPVCIRRSNTVTNLNPIRFCDPLGGQNIWATALPLVDYVARKPIKYRYVIVSARLDTTSMFDKTAGANAPITGVVALLATARYLKTLLQLKDNIKYEKNVLFLLLNGETYDYIGSQRLLYDMSRGEFPANDTAIPLPTIKPDDIDLFIELSQLGGGDSVTAHYLDPTNPKQFVSKLQSYKNRLSLAESATLPPASYHTFVKHREDLRGLILSDHQREYTNKFYNSLYDNATNIGYKYMNLSGEIPVGLGGVQNYIGNIATMLGKSIFEEITKTSPPEAEVDLELIDELFHCYLEDSNCKVHQAIQKTTIKDTFNWYVSVKPKLLTTLIGLTLGWLTADDLGESNANCTNKEYPVYNMSAGINDLNDTRCFRFTMNWTDAISPAFMIDDYDWSSGLYSTWTESTWYEIRLRAFLKPSAAHENMTIAIGSMVFIFSLVFVYFVKNRSDILFPQPVATQAPTHC